MQGEANKNILDIHGPAFSLFNNIQASNDRVVYWSGTEFWDGDNAGYFQFSNGGQGDIAKWANFATVWAVRDGDVVSPSPVPEPETNILMLTGLTALYLTKRRK